MVLLWEKISDFIYKKFKIKINYKPTLVFIIIMGIIFLLLYNQFMISFLIDGCELVETDGVFTLKNLNTTIGFVRFNKIGEVEYIFVNPIFRKKGIAKKLLKLVKDKTKKKITYQTPISHLGSKLLKFLEK